ncbi:MAG TPA: cupin domain-containing protein [Gaiellaceae bacterium]|jgi:mannose-6-phosphate isomerase-like protein (cupin superfamily)
MRYHLQAEGGDDDETALFGAARGCAEFEQRLLRFDGGGERAALSDDEVLYVLAGSGTATIDREPVELRAGTALYIAAGAGWRVDGADGLELMSVIVRNPLPSSVRHAVVGVDDVEVGEATAGRMFRLLAPCPSATQFVGYIPPGRAPDHYHRYDEVVYVLEGEGALHIDGESAPLQPGSCIHLPATLVHSLENHGPGEMQVLGVFSPAGSPAEAYYVDGTAAFEY